MTSGFRWAIFLGFLAVSVLITFLLWPHGAALFLVLPFVFPFSFGGRRKDLSIHHCPLCGWSTTDDDLRFCPRDATKLETAP